MSTNQIYELVQGLLDQAQPKKYKLSASLDGIQHNGDWWYVVVTPSVPEISANDYARRMSKIENDLERQQGIKVLLLPALVD